MFFNDIIGQEITKKYLIRSVLEKRISHAQLFLGKEGNGALPLAVAYAQYILCKNKNENDSCGKCPSCLKSAKLIHPDIHFVYPLALKKGEVEISTDIITQWRESFLKNPYLSLSDWFSFLDAENKQPVIGVKESEEIIRKLSVTVYEGEFKVIIFWLPEKMNLSAANKLLKTLEEPPGHSLFILISEDEEQLLPTVYSRTQLIKITPLSDNEIKYALTTTHHLSLNDAERIAYLADGNYHLALKLLAENRDEKFFLLQFKDWMRMCFKTDIISIVPWIENFVKTGREKQKEFLIFGNSIIRECVMRIYGDSKLLRVEGEELDFVNRFSSRLDAPTCKQLFEEFNKAILHIERNGNTKLVFIDLSLKCMQIIKHTQRTPVNNP